MSIASHKIVIFSVALLLLGCGANSTYKSADAQTESLQPWMTEMMRYTENIPSEHPDSYESVFLVSEEMRLSVVDKFGDLPKDIAMEKLADWLVDDEGLSMRYELEANFSPLESYEKRLANCLSFTILLASLAAELGIDVYYNQVDIPEVWQQNEDKGLFLYRHINVVHKTSRGTRQIFDLAIENYDFGYPQREVDSHWIAANLYSNKGVNAFYDDDRDSAFHYMSLAVSVDPDNSDIWNNLGALLRRAGELEKAEQAFLHSLALKEGHMLAASNLEKLYRSNGQKERAAIYADIAREARKNNPYYYYQLAERQFGVGDFSEASKSLRRAKKLHDRDPRFFELNSLVLQSMQRYRQALRELEKAYVLAVDETERTRYMNEALLVAQLAEESDRKSRRGFVVVQEAGLIIETY